MMRTTLGHAVRRAASLQVCRSLGGGALTPRRFEMNTLSPVRSPTISCSSGFVHQQQQRSCFSRTTSEDEKVSEEEEAQVVREKLRDLQPTLEKQEAGGDLSKAEQTLLNALREHKDDTNQDSLKRLRDCYQDLTYWDYALDMEQKLKDLTERDTVERADCLYRQGKLYMRMEQILPASRLYQQALEMYEKQKDADTDTDTNIAIGNIKISLAGVHYHRKNFETATTLLLEAETYFPPDHADLVTCLQHQGLLYRTVEDFETAQQEYQRALHLATELKLKEETIKSLRLGMADMHMAMGEFDRALFLYQSLLDESCKDEPTEAVLLHNIGKIYSQQGQYDKAIEKLTRSIDLKRKLAGRENDGINSEIGKTLNVLGAVYAVTDNKAAALKCFQESLLIARAVADSPDDPAIFYALRNISVLKGEKVPKWGEQDDEQKSSNSTGSS